MKNHPFIHYLCKLALAENSNGRAALAHLRRGLNKPSGHAPEMFPHVIPFLPIGLSERQEDAYYILASLFAMHPKHDDSINSLGDTFRRISRNTPDSEGPERRFIALLNAHSDDLPSHLRHAVSLAKSQDVPINYERLLDDFIAWDYEFRKVQKNWARDFWTTANRCLEEIPEPENIQNGQEVVET